MTTNNMTGNIFSSDNVIDTRDILERIEDLRLDTMGLDIDEHEELILLSRFVEEYGTDTWKDGEALILDSYFQEYIEEKADDLGLMDSDNPLFTYVDWEGYAKDSQVDYYPVEFDGVDYWLGC